MTQNTISILEQEIKNLKNQSYSHNDANSIVILYQKEISALIKETIGKTNQTASVDERLKNLVEGLQKIMSYIEDNASRHLSKSQKIKSDILLLESVLKKVNDSVEKEKKDSGNDKQKQK